MPLALPIPQPPRGMTVPRPHQRAWRCWQDGQHLAERQQWLAAAKAFAQATQLHADLPYGLAAVHALIRAGRARDAVHGAEALQQRHPGSALAYTLHAHALLELGLHEPAVRVLREMPPEIKRDIDHLLALGLALQRGHKHGEAITVFFEALALKMEDAHLHFHLGTSFKELGLKAEAAECVRTAVMLGVGTSELAARGLLCFLEREACRWELAEHELASLRRKVNALQAGQPMEANPFCHAVLVDEPGEVMRVAQHHALHLQGRTHALWRRAAKAHGGRLRLGYLSSDFHTHATSQLMVQMLEHHDRSAFEVTLFSAGPDDKSATRARVQAACEHFVNLRGQGHAAMARTIREAEIDVLVDLKGITHDNLMPVLAQRPAPVQLSWLGFPGSTGAPYIDYVIGDAVVTPLENAAHFTEKIAQLPRCYQPNDNLRARPPAGARSAFGVDEETLLLCGFHQSYKISAPVFDQWCGLLRELPQARLWLLAWNASVEGALHAAAAQRGIAPERLLFAPVLPLAEHLARLACADIFLDTWPCNAHTTASEALWMGVPVVSLRGSTFANRVGASLLHAVGLDELVCTGVESYRDTVIALGRDAPRRQRLRAHLGGQRGADGLFDGKLFAREFEALLQRIWQRAC